MSKAGLSRTRFLLLVGGFATTGPATAQEVALVIHGGHKERIGTHVSGMPDMNDDGVPDIVSGASTLGLARGGFVAVYSGVDGAILQGPHWAGLSEGFGRGASRAGDFDGDGIEDYMAGNTQWDDPVFQSGEVRLYSGATGQFITRLEALKTSQDRLGASQIPLGDVDLDGYDDVAAVPQSDSYVAIFGGPDGHVIRRHSAVTYARVARLDDLNADGVSEYAIGSPDWDDPDWYTGKIEVFDGLSGSMIYRVSGPHAYSYFGPVTALSDIDGDGIGDWAAGASGTPGTVNALCYQAPGQISFHSGADGHLIRRIAAPTGEKEAFAWQLRGGGDVNGDGFWDLLVSSPCWWTQLRVYSGRTGTHLWSLKVGELDHLGYEIDKGKYLGINILGDLNLDGCAEWGVGADEIDKQTQWNGAIVVFAGAPGDAEIVCTASPNSVGDGARLETFGSISVGDDELELRAHGAPPGELGQFRYGPEGSSTTYGDGALCIDLDGRGTFPLAPLQTIEPDGTVALEVPFDTLATGPGAWAPGSTWVTQFVYQDPGGPGGTGFNTSDALRVTLNP